MKRTLFILLLFATLLAMAQPKAEKEIRSLLATQTEAWNRGDIEGFMQTYWQSDSLLFVGKSGVVRGWQQTLDNYKKGYPTKDAMGTLSFAILQVKPVSSQYYSVVGKWMLQRTAGDLSGHYTLLLKRIRGQWKIVMDHSS